MNAVMPYVEAMRPHFIILLVVVPLMAAPLIMLIGRNSSGSCWHCSPALFSFGASLMLLLDVLRVGIVSYHYRRLGAACWDRVPRRCGECISLLLMVVGHQHGRAALRAHSIEREIAETHHALFYACYCCVSPAFWASRSPGTRSTSSFSSKFRRSRPMC